MSFATIIAMHYFNVAQPDNMLYYILIQEHQMSKTLCHLGGKF